MNGDDGSDISSSSASYASSSDEPDWHGSQPKSSASSTSSTDSAPPRPPLRPLQEYIKEASDGFVYPGVPRSGSKPNLGRVFVKSVKKVDSEMKYRRQLASNGQHLIKEVRLRHRDAREILKLAGHETTGLESSSDDELDKDDSIDPDSRSIDWLQLGRATWWADEPIFNAMSVSAISSAVGWAHHQTSDEQDRKFSIKELNPYLDLPNTPMPSSHLDWIAQRATKRMKTEVIMWKKITFLTQSEHEIEQPSAVTTHRKLKRLEWQTWACDSEDETYQLLKSVKPTRSVDVTVPLVRRVKVTETCMSESFSTSALVAMGVAVEEMLTASFLPLARQHVERCRKLVDRHAIDEWTLPPEESILKLDSGTASLGTARDLAQPADFARWCESRDLDAEFILENMDLYGRVHPFRISESSFHASTVKLRRKGKMSPKAARIARINQG